MSHINLPLVFQNLENIFFRMRTIQSHKLIAYLDCLLKLHKLSPMTSSQHYPAKNNLGVQVIVLKS